jgi:oligopeptide/dipeptide ABC transporter ATP-binding protein
MTHPAPILQVDEARVLFPVGHRKLLRAVDGVSFEVQAGETFGIIGESGSGKSTLGRALVCLQRLSGGALQHDGIDPAQLGAKRLRQHRRSFQMVFQDPNASLNPRIAVGESIREPLDIAGEGTREERTRRVAALMERVGLHPALAARFPHELSGGQKQRVNIARALTLRPRVIVCDEVVAALDVSIQADVLNLFAELQREFGLTYVFISHDLGVVSHISDRIAVMYLGRLMELGPAETLTKAPAHPYTQALMAAEPVPLPPSMRGKRSPALQGEIPNPVDPPSGCRFRTRCPRATERCMAEEPAWRQLRPGHWVACHFPMQPEDLKESS